MRKIVIGLSILFIIQMLPSGAFVIENTLEKNCSYSFNNLEINEQSNDIVVTINGADSIYLKQSYYSIPTTIKTFIFPIGTKIHTVSCSIENIISTPVTKEPRMTPKMMSSNWKSNQSMDSDMKPKTIDQWFTYDIGRGMDGSIPCIIVRVQLFPVRYDPVDKILLSVEHMNINIEYSETITQSSNNDNYSFLIIAPETFVNDLEPLVDYKINKGIETKLISLLDIYSGIHFDAVGRDEAEMIKYFIKNAYENWGTTSVLLVGGSDFLPVRYSNVKLIDEGQSYSKVFVSDLYYADLYDEDNVFQTWDSNENDVFGEYNWSGLYDDVDLYPDIQIGRLACINNDEVTNCVNKIINYEEIEGYQQDWFSNYVMVAGDTAPHDDEHIDEGEYAAEQSLQIMNGFIPVRVYASNDDLLTRGPINDAINQGAGFALLSGHGHRTIWSTHPHDRENIWLPPGNYRSQDAADLNNNEKLPIIVSDACYIGQFDRASNCFSWSFVSNPNGGAIGMFSSTSTSFFYPTSYVTEDIIGKMVQDTFKAYREDDAITLGEMWIRALNNYISPSMDGADFFTTQEWILFGDPTVRIAEDSLPPVKPSIEGPSSGKSGEEYNFTATSIDPDQNQIYYLFDWGNGEFSEWIGPFPSGETAELSYIWTEEGTYEVRSLAKDDHGVQSEWSDPLPISMPKTREINIVNVLLQRFIVRFPFLTFLLDVKC